VVKKKKAAHRGRKKGGITRNAQLQEKGDEMGRTPGKKMGGTLCEKGRTNMRKRAKAWEKKPRKKSQRAKKKSQW